MNKIAKSSPHTSFAAVEATTRFSEIGDGGELAVDGARGIPTAIEGVAGLLGGIFVFEAGVDVADEVCWLGVRFRLWVDGWWGEGLTVVVIITHHDFLWFTVLAHLAPKIFVKGVEVVLQLAGVHLVFRIVGGVLIEVGEENGLRIGRFDMFS